MTSIRALVTGALLALAAATPPAQAKPIICVVPDQTGTLVCLEDGPCVSTYGPVAEIEHLSCPDGPNPAP